jgi:hypothetical protein
MDLALAYVQVDSVDSAEPSEVLAEADGSQGWLTRHAADATNLGEATQW